MPKLAYLIGVDALATRDDVSLDSYAEPELDEVRDVADRAVAEVEAADAEPRPVGRVLESPIDGVSDAAWTEFALVMRVQDVGAMSASNEFGMFAMKPRRLADLGLMRDLRRGHSPVGRVVWLGDWVAPLSRDAFLSSPKVQYRAFVVSCRCYVEGLRDRTISTPGQWPGGLSLSGALAVLHKCGPSGLVSWGDEGGRFPGTAALVERANGIF